MDEKYNNSCHIYKVIENKIEEKKFYKQLIFEMRRKNVKKITNIDIVYSIFYNESSKSTRFFKTQEIPIYFISKK